jgi:hypothetical protein
MPNRVSKAHSSYILDDGTWPFSTLSPGLWTLSVLLTWATSPESPYYIQRCRPWDDCNPTHPPAPHREGSPSLAPALGMKTAIAQIPTECPLSTGVQKPPLPLPGNKITGCFLWCVLGTQMRQEPRHSGSEATCPRLLVKHSWNSRASRTCEKCLSRGAAPARAVRHVPCSEDAAAIASAPLGSGVSQK